MSKLDQIADLFQKGSALHQQGNLEEALVIYDQAIRIKSDYAEAYYCRGMILCQIERFEEALVSFDQAIAINPNHAGTYNNRGVVLKELNRFSDAIDAYNQAIAIEPTYAHFYYNRGYALQKLNKFDEAVVNYDQVITNNPGYLDAYSNRGYLLQELKRFDEALANYDQALAVNPDYAEAYSDRGIALKKLKRPDEALASYNQAIKINPDYAEAYSNRGSILQDLKRPDEALASYNQAIKINPDYADAYYNRGALFQGLKHFNEALNDYAQAIRINPNYVNAHWNTSICNLMRGNFKAGWQAYEWRWGHFQCDSEPLKSNKPAWDYQKTNQRLLVWAEQGIGDHILFGSLLSELLEDVPNLLVQIDKRLISIFSRSLPTIKFYPSINLDPNSDSKVPESDYDVHVPIGSLGKYLRNDEKDFNNSRYRFLKDDEVKTVKIKKYLMTLNKSKNKICGISWSSKSKSSGSSKNIDLKYLIERLNLEEYSFVSLQYGKTKDEIKIIRDELGINIISYEQVDNFTDIDGLSSLIQACDTVISVDNITCQLAGALGKQIHILLPFYTHWAWMLDREDSPWYPSAKLYRQEKINDWDTVLEKLKADLLKLKN